VPARLTSRDNAHTDARRRRRRFKVGRVLVFNDPLIQTRVGGGGEGSTLTRVFVLNTPPACCTVAERAALPRAKRSSKLTKKNQNSLDTRLRRAPDLVRCFSALVARSMTNGISTYTMSSTRQEGQREQALESMSEHHLIQVP